MALEWEVQGMRNVSYIEVFFMKAKVHFISYVHKILVGGFTKSDYKIKECICIRGE